MIISPNNAAIGIAYSLWLRLRWVMAGMLAYMAIMVVTVQLFPHPQAAIGAFPLAAVVAHLLTVFTLGPVDLSARGSGFPKSMFVLPVRTRSLVCWPMLYGAATFAGLWMFVTTLILKPAGLNAPVVWPAAVASAATAWLQAIGWSPFPSPFVRVPALAMALTPLSLLVAWAYMFFEGHNVSIAIVVGSLMWMSLAYIFAIHGLSRARRGCDGERFRAFVARIVAHRQEHCVRAAGLRPPFRSASRAQFWHECRRNAVTFPIFLSLVGLPMLGILVPAVIDGDASKNLMVSSVVVTPAILGLAAIVGMLLLMSALYGPNYGKFDVWGKERMASFFAIRPMATAEFIAIKVVAAAIGALAAWVIVIAVLAIWAILEASPLNPRDSLVKSALNDTSAREVVIFVVLLAGLYAQTCRGLVVGMWATLAGRNWLPNLLGVLSMAILSVAVLAGIWVSKHPEVQPRLIVLVPWLVGVALAAKLGGAAWVFLELRKHHLLSSRAMKIWLSGWVIAGAILVASLSFVVTPTLLLVAGVFLMLPLTRIAFSPLALHWNRHR